MGDDSKTCEELLLRYDEPGGVRALVLDDDGKVAYGYLLEREAVVGDVWLYNVAATPNTVDWNDKSQMPFLNPQKFCKAETVPRLNPQSLEIRWFEAGVEVIADGILLARLESGAK